MLIPSRLKTVILPLCLFFTFSLLSGCNEAVEPVAVNGTINLTGWDFSKGNTVSLNGMWEFYPDLLLSPDDFSGEEKRAVCSYIKVPGMWADQPAEGITLPSKGYMTYRLRLISGTDLKLKTICMYRIYSGYKIWINGIPAGEKGMPDVFSVNGVIKKDVNYIFIHNKKYINFKPVDGTSEIVLQVVNYDNKSGGIGRPLILENEEANLHKRFVRHTVEMIIVGLALFFAIINLLLYFYRKENITALYCGLFSLVVAINVFNLHIPILSGPFEWPRNPYLLNYTSVILLVMFFLLMVRSLFPEDFYTPVIKINHGVTFFVLSLIVFTGFSTAEKIMKIYFIAMLLFILYCMYVFFKAMRKHRDDSVLFFIGYVPILIFAINDVLYASWIIDTTNITQYALVILCITTTLVVARRYSRTLQSLSDDLIEKNVSLEKLDRIKDQFLANTSHELRTPLHGMIGLSESMLEGTAGVLTQKARENLSLIVSSGYRLAGMVNDLLDMARIQDKGLNLNLGNLDLHRLSENVMRLSLPLTGSKPIELINSIPEDISFVLADEERIRQVLLNLVGNAIKFTAKGKIEISARILPHDNNGYTGISEMVEISVSDTGVGVPEEYMEMIFDKYIQVDSDDTRFYAGTGLGLAIAKQIVELHNGIISITPNKDCGSIFKFTLPVWAGSTVHECKEVIVEGMNDSLTQYISDNRSSSYRTEADREIHERPVFLVVDDDPINIKILLNYFEAKNYVIRTALDGVTALEIIEKSKDIDLVLLDIMMPVMSGYEVCRRIRLKYSPEELPVIMLTAKNMISDIDAAFNAGANDYIVKPFRISELFARSETMLKLRSIRKTPANGITIHGNTTYSFLFSDMVYISSKLKNIIIHSRESDIEIPIMMKDIEGRLPCDIFLRIHKSYIINMQYFHSINHVVSGRYRVRLHDNDDTILPVGTVYLAKIRKKIS